MTVGEGVAVIRSAFADQVLQEGRRANPNQHVTLHPDGVTGPVRVFMLPSRRDSMEDESNSYADSTRILLSKPPRPNSSGLTLVLPSLKALKARQTQQPSPYDVDLQEKRIPRPIKLKPLKEVLVKLITQIKKWATRTLVANSRWSRSSSASPGKTIMLSFWPQLTPLPCQAMRMLSSNQWTLER